jgi:4a-hydroxytetrahydrobiopterin dehydratase
MALHLSDKKCVACEGDVPPLTPAEVEKYMPELKNKWPVVDNKKIKHQFEFKDFISAIKFVDQVAAIAESEGHHPDILVHGWNKVTIELSTHAIKGLSENDFILAAKIEKLFN